MDVVVYSRDGTPQKVGKVVSIMGREVGLVITDKSAYEAIMICSTGEPNYELAIMPIPAVQRDPGGLMDEAGRQEQQHVIVSIYQQKAVRLVYAYIKSKLEITDTHVTFGIDEVYVISFMKTLRNWKALISTTLPDGMVYEVTYNGERAETYIDAYKKWDNVCIKDVSPDGIREAFGVVEEEHAS